MKRILILTVASLMFAGAARADHFGIYSDASGASCDLAAGFSSTATIIQKFSLGTTGARFRVDLSLCPGTLFFVLSTPYTPVGDPVSDVSIGYGQCLTGSVVVGNIVAVWSPGAVSIVPAVGFPNIIYANCAFVQFNATGGHASIAGDGHGCDGDPVEPSTWGGVKALYR